MLAPSGTATSVVPRDLQESCTCVLELLTSLTPDHRAILKAVDLEQNPVREVAPRLGITVNAATVRLHRARRALRERLLDRCGTTSVASCLDCPC